MRNARVGFGLGWMLVLMAVPAMAQAQRSARLSFRYAADNPVAVSPAVATDPAKVKQSITEKLQNRLGAAPEEWSILAPRIARVCELYADVVAGGSVLTAYNVLGTDFQTVVGSDASILQIPASSGGPTSVVQDRISQLQAAVQNAQTNGRELQLKIEALREARQAARNELAKAREELTTLLTARQEAALIQIGLLE